MCSVVGYVGINLSKDFVINGLSRLEYRGYDSAGYACINQEDGQLSYAKASGLLANLVSKLSQNIFDGSIALGHTRWSTHGVASELNAHPHFDCAGALALVHNGIIENYTALKTELLKKHSFVSETDTEVVVHLFEDIVEKHATLQDAVKELVSTIKGAYALVFIAKKFPDTLILVRRRSPLCIGIGNQEMFVASDTLAFSDKTDKVVYMPDESFALVTNSNCALYAFDGTPLEPVVQLLDARWQAADKGGFESYMLKEIYEQKTVIGASVAYYASLKDTLLNRLGLSHDEMNELETINLFACGTSWHAALIAKFFFEEVAHIKTNVLLSSEFRYAKIFPDKNALYIAISQSGETADTLEALRLLNEMGLKTAVITNVASSSMVREAGGSLIMQAGPEMAVASTKAFSTQVATLYWLAHKMALDKQLITPERMHVAHENILVAAEILEFSIENYKTSIDLNVAQHYATYKKLIFLGRHISYPFALEAALKLKEISYLFVQTYPAGELKHGPIALLEKGMPVFIFSCLDTVVYEKLLGNVQEVKSRGAYVVSFVFEHQAELIAMSDDVFILPQVDPLLAPLAMTGVMQYLCYKIAQQLGCSIDKPRNLAKSVTVE